MSSFICLLLKHSSAKGEDDIRGSFVLTHDALFLAHWDAARFSKWFSVSFWSTAASCALQTGKVMPISCSIYDLSNKKYGRLKKKTQTPLPKPDSQISL